MMGVGRKTARMRATRRWSCAVLALALTLPGTSLPVRAQLSVNMRDVDVRAFIQDAARQTGRVFVVDPRVQGKVTLVTSRPVSRSEYFELFLATLRANGQIAVPMAGGGYRIQPADAAAAQAGGVGRSVSRHQMTTEIFRLRTADATAVVDTVRPLVGKEGSVTANRTSNSLVIVDFADNLPRIRAVIARIDRDTGTTETLYLRNLGAREIVGALQPMSGGSVAIAAVDGANAVLMRGDAQAVARMARLARELDGRVGANTEVRIFSLEHADAEAMMPMLQALVGQTPTSSSGSQATPPTTAIAANEPRPTSASGPSASTSEATNPISGTYGGGQGRGIAGPNGAVITRYDGANAVIVAGSPDVLRQLGEVIRQLDIRREQVLIEALIVEVSDNAAKRLGVQMLYGGKNSPFFATNFSNAEPDIAALVGGYVGYENNKNENDNNDDSSDSSNNNNNNNNNNIINDTLIDTGIQALAAATGGFGGFLTKIGKNSLFGAIINAVRSDTKSNLLATPSIMTVDNKRAYFLVGQEVPIATGETLSPNFDNAFRTVRRENVGIMLEVTPQINSSGEVKLGLRQTVSSVAGPVSQRNGDLVINKREFETTLVVDNGEIMVIGGLLNDDERRTLQKVPLLGNIPIIGNLFKSRTASRVKSNLLVFIRPTIIRSREEAAALTAQRYGYVRDSQLAYNPKREPTIDELVRGYMGAVPPGAEKAKTDDLAILPDGRELPVKPEPVKP